MPLMTDVAIIGAGPYGLSLAAHLSALGVSNRVLGSPMQFWRAGMPEGMSLKSEGFASSLYDPDGAFTLRAYCAQKGLPYADVGLPVPLQTFVDYGIAFQRRFVPSLVERRVASVDPDSAGFTLKLDDGHTVSASRVVAATGIDNFGYVPPELQPLRGRLVSHSSEHHDLRPLAGRNVVIVGSGASAIDLAALLSDQDATVTVVARDTKVAWCNPPRPRSLLDDIQAPVSGLGTGWRSLACVKAPMVFYHMPHGFRHLVVKKHLPAAAGWTVRDRVEQNVSFVMGATIAAANERNGRAELTLRLLDGETRSLTADHVIAATGFKVDMTRLNYLGGRIRATLRCIERTPVLSPYFESSVPGLFFVGAAAANSFGPMLRFAYGAGFAATRLSRYLNRSASRRAQVSEAAPAQMQAA